MARTQEQRAERVKRRVRKLHRAVEEYVCHHGDLDSETMAEAEGLGITFNSGGTGNGPPPSGGG